MAKSSRRRSSADEPLVELETDKVNVEVPSPTNGVLGSIAVKEGETVNVGSLLGTVNGLSKNIDNTVKEANNYKPPKKENEIKKPKIFEEEKISKIKNKILKKLK